LGGPAGLASSFALQRRRRRPRSGRLFPLQPRSMIAGSPALEEAALDDQPAPQPWENGRVVGLVLRVVIGLIGAVTIYVIGAAVLRKFKIEPEPEPDPSDLRPVEVEFRCTVCGTTVVMTAAPGDDPEPPRHCREDMVRA
jgi:hypothetical protein